MLKNLYASDVSAGTMEQVRHEIPFSQIIDVDGLTDDWQCQVFLDVVSSDVHISVNQNGESCLLAVSIKLAAQLQCYRTGSSEVVIDAYSARCPLKLETDRLDTQHLMHVRRETNVVKEAFELPPDGVSDIVDVWMRGVAARSEMRGWKSLCGRAAADFHAGPGSRRGNRLL